MQQPKSRLSSACRAKSAAPMLRRSARPACRGTGPLDEDWIDGRDARAVPDARDRTVHQHHDDLAIIVFIEPVGCPRLPMSGRSKLRSWKGCLVNISGWIFRLILGLGLQISLQMPSTDILRKEVIQPQVPLRLPCYDFTPVADLTVAGCPLAVSPPSSGKANSHGVTGGVYKARERIHRGMLIHDY